MPKKPALGRGLDALMPFSEEEYGKEISSKNGNFDDTANSVAKPLNVPSGITVDENGTLWVNPALLKPNPEQPRHEFAQDELQELSDSIKEKLALFCNVRKECVIQNMTADNLYAIPLLLEKEGLAVEACKKLELSNIKPKNQEWEQMVENIRSIGDNTVNIAIVGKYVQLEDSYISVMESIRHAGFANKVHTKITLINSEEITKENVAKKLEGVQGIVVPGGFGTRGVEGKIETIKYARENKKVVYERSTFLGLVMKEYENVLCISGTHGKIGRS